MCITMETMLKIKKWGHSLGAVIPKETVEKMDLKEDEIINIEITRRKRIDGFGILKEAKPFEREEDILDR
mgnify:CR=1 FL=1